MREAKNSDKVKVHYTGKLTDGELMGYKKALAFLSNLDGIQLNNLTMTYKYCYGTGQVSRRRYEYLYVVLDRQQ